MNKLYPLKFKPIYKDKIWGGQKIKNILKKDVGDIPNCGEMWLVSGVEGDLSMVENGFLAGNNIDEVAEIFMQDLLGDNVFSKYGEKFPLLLKIIDANDYLSIQVHPDDELAMERHQEKFGKTEMWYILNADKNAELISGFKKETTKESFVEKLKDNELKDILNTEEVKQDDAFFIPAGRIHALGPGIMLAEIQQSSDTTYRIYDWDRLGIDGLPRETHVESALDALDYKTYENYKTPYQTETNKTNKIIECEHFTTNILKFNQILEKSFESVDSFVLYLCLESAFEIHYEGGKELVKQGEAILIPASMEKAFFIPLVQSKVLEIHI